MAGFEAWRAGEAQSAGPRAPHPSERPHSCTCWGKHLNGNNVKFHSYLMSSDLTGPRGKDRSKMIVLDKFLKAKKSNRQTLQKRRLRNEKRKPAHKTVAVAHPAQRQPQPQPWALARLFMYLFVRPPLHKTRGVTVLYQIHTEIEFHLNSPRTWEEKFTVGEETGGNNYSETFNQFETAFPEVERK